MEELKKVVSGVTYQLVPTEECDADYTEYNILNGKTYLGSISTYTKENKWYSYNSKEEEIGQYASLKGALHKVVGEN